MTPEGRITRTIIRHLKRLRAQGEPIWWHKLAGHPMQAGGIPDLIVCYSGQWLLIELKTPGRQPGPRQAYTVQQIQEAGGRVLVADSTETVVEELEDLKCTWLRLNGGRSSPPT
ncbi:MAG TPA: VRR-NUC domain-containing protein [Thermoguttaceae bacterium]|nr:VRR-NUC domain-containing protein [Thermoguttaceae bacterium]